MSWFVVHTQARKESLATMHLQAQGFECFLPRCWVQRRHARKTVSALEPLFPRYLFVQLDPDKSLWRSINGTRGVSYILSQDNRPIGIDARIISGLQERMLADESIPVQDAMALLVPGDRLRVLEGPFAEYPAVFDGWDAKGRVLVLLSFLGRDLRCTLLASAIERY